MTAKHAHASVVHVELDTPDAILQLAIRDDGIGGADPGQGSGLVGLSDRIEALGGTLQVTPTGNGTTMLIEVPLEGQRKARRIDLLAAHRWRPRASCGAAKEYALGGRHGRRALPTAVPSTTRSNLRNPTG